MNNLSIRPANTSDLPLLLTMIRELAEAEDFPHGVTLTEAGLHLDDLFVRPRFQGAGYGKALMAYIAGIAVDRQCARFEWWALRSNASALRFYESIGARQMDELLVHRLQGEDIARLARG